MRTVVVLLLLCVCDPGHSDCSADCLACRHTLPRQLRVHSMACLVECEGNASPAPSWDLCRQALVSVRRRSQEEAEALLPAQDHEDEEPGDDWPPPQRSDLLSRVYGTGRMAPSGAVDYDSRGGLILEDEFQEEAGREEVRSEVAAPSEDRSDPGISKRFGGFVKGRHSYRKLLAPGRSYQKRYGGFIGIRKSARKWNNQKRFSEFLRQYLGMGARNPDAPEGRTHDAV